MIGNRHIMDRLLSYSSTTCDCQQSVGKCLFWLEIALSLRMNALEEDVQLNPLQKKEQKAELKRQVRELEKRISHVLRVL